MSSVVALQIEEVPLKYEYVRESDDVVLGKLTNGSLKTMGLSQVFLSRQSGAQSYAARQGERSEGA